MNDDGTSLVEMDSMVEERENTHIVGGGGGDGTFLVGFDSMEVETENYAVAGDGGDGGGGGIEEGIWIDNLHHLKLDDDQFFIVDDASEQASSFYNMDFQPLTADDFPCMSSSSSSTSSTPVPANPPVITVSSSSSSASWTIMRPEEVDQDLLHAAAEVQDSIHFGAAPRIGGTLSSTLSMEDGSFFNLDDCMNDYNIENFQLPGPMDVNHEIWNPSSIFQVEKSAGEKENRTYLHPPPTPTPLQSSMAAAAGGASAPHLTRQTLQPDQQPYATYTPDPYNLQSPPAMVTDQYQQQQTWQMPAAPVTDQYQQQIWKAAAPVQLAPENNASVEANLGGYGGNPQVYPYYPGSSKKARQRRMAKLRGRMFSHQYNIQPNRHINVNRNLPMTQIPNPVPNVAPTNTVPANRPVYMQGQNYHQQQQMRQQGWKHEKNLKFLFQKILKQSDVSRAGRMVLPKKHAEDSLPKLESGNGISIAMEDFGTSRVWYMRYRFWPNNKSRMYVLENAGEFVRTHRLEEGDIIVVYSDKKREKYMIRAVKVRPFERKPEVKKKKKAAARVTRTIDQHPPPWPEKNI